MSDITKQSLTELVESIKNKKLSSSEVTNAFIERSEKSKVLNAFITEDFTSALDKAKKFDQKPNLDLKLPGIPMAVKDLFCTKNVKTTAGSKILNNFVPLVLLDLRKKQKQQFHILNNYHRLVLNQLFQ